MSVQSSLDTCLAIIVFYKRVDEMMIALCYASYTCDASLALWLNLWLYLWLYELRLLGCSFHNLCLSVCTFHCVQNVQP